jgi:hypothetical protein
MPTDQRRAVLEKQRAQVLAKSKKFDDDNGKYMKPGEERWMMEGTHSTRANSTGKTKKTEAQWNEFFDNLKTKREKMREEAGDRGGNWRAPVRGQWSSRRSSQHHRKGSTRRR